MVLQENISSAPKKKLLHPLRYRFVKTIPFISALVVSYIFVEIVVLSTMMDYLLDSKKMENQRTAAVVTNLQDGLSSVLFVFVSHISESYTGSFTMITFCTAASIQGIMLLWTSTLPSAFDAVYAAIFILTFGRSGQKLSEQFLEYHIEEEIEAEKESTENQKKQNLIKTINNRFILNNNSWLYLPSVTAYLMIAGLAIVETTFDNLFRFAALIMGGTHLLFLFGCVCYSREELSVESNLRKIFRICKAALGKWDSKYPTSPNGYYWKDYKHNHLYKHGEGLRLSPRVPRLLRWLDKAAIVKVEEEEVRLETQQKNGKLCTVKEVREVKSLVPMIYLSLTIFPYSLLLASGNTFFVAQAIKISEDMNSDGFNISHLFLIKAFVCDLSRLACFFISFASLKKFRAIDFMSKRKAATIIRISFGIACAVICSAVAWQVQVHRLTLNKWNLLALVPQYILLGMAEGIFDGGLARLFLDNVAKSMWSFKDSFCEMVIGTGKLLVIPIVLIFSGWFKETIDASHFDRYYLMLAILNVVLFLPFAYYYNIYAYKEEYPEDEKITVEQTLEHAHQLDSQDSYLKNDNEA